MQAQLFHSSLHQTNKFQSQRILKEVWVLLFPLLEKKKIYSSVEKRQELNLIYFKIHCNTVHTSFEIYRCLLPQCQEKGKEVYQSL